MSVVTITKDNFKTEVLESERPVLLDFWAPVVRPRRMVSPVVDEIAAENEGFKVGKVNVDEEEELARPVPGDEHPNPHRFSGGEGGHQLGGRQAEGGNPQDARGLSANIAKGRNHRFRPFVRQNRLRFSAWERYSIARRPQRLFPFGSRAGQ